jgi:hypothetical protein
MVSSLGIPVKSIQGFVKGFDYRPGYLFKTGQDALHQWNAIFLLGSWRFIDVTMASGFTDHSGLFVKKLNEHYFLTDPEVMIWTHFPLEISDFISVPRVSSLEHPTGKSTLNDSCYWQLLERPFFLEEFNALPKVTPAFFECKLRFRSKVTESHPIVFRVQTDIKISSHEPMRYKYKLFPADEAESSSLNHYAFCQLKEERTLGCFTVVPPHEGKFFLKVGSLSNVLFKRCINS